MRPEEIEQLLGAYALDAVEDDERRVVEEYLSTDPRARAEVQQHREVATMLAFTGAPAPEGLWDRIAATIEDQAPAPGPELAKVLPMAHRRRRAGWLVAGGIAASAVALVGLLSFGFFQRGRQIDDLRQQAVTQVDVQQLFADAVTDPQADLLDLRSEDGSLTARAVVDPRGFGVLAAQSLPTLAADRTYQLWGVFPGDKVISLGVLGNGPGLFTFSTVDGLKALVLTDEEGSGVPVSTQPALLAGTLS